MTFADLTDAQLKQLAQTTARHRDFYTKLVERMKQLKFPPDDPMYAAAMKAFEGASWLTVGASSEVNRRKNET